MRRLGTVLSVAVAALTLVAAGCQRSGGTNEQTTAPEETIASASPTPGPDDEITPPPGGFSSDPVTVSHQVSVPPVPVIVGIRSAAHSADGYDRIVFDISGAIPGYQIRYVDHPVEDPSGKPAVIPAGRRFLEIRFEPAQAHDSGGNPTVAVEKVLGYPMLKAYRITADFEGVTTVVLGLDDVVGFRVGELSSPNRVYVDVAA